MAVVRIAQAIAGATFSHPPGEYVEMPDDLAQRYAASDVVVVERAPAGARVVVFGGSTQATKTPPAPPAKAPRGQKATATPAGQQATRRNTPTG